MSNYYELLEISENATSDAIKKAYRKMAKKWHPDMNPDLDTTEQFVAVEVAYSALSNRRSREAYDRLLQMERERISNPALNRRYAQTVRKTTKQQRNRARNHSNMSYDQYRRDESFHDSFVATVVKTVFFLLVAVGYFWGVTSLVYQHDREVRGHIDPSVPGSLIGVLIVGALPFLIILSYIYEPIIQFLLIGSPKRKGKKSK